MSSELEIVDQIIGDLTNHQSAWWDIDEDIRAEIREEWASLIRQRDAEHKAALLEAVGEAEDPAQHSDYGSEMPVIARNHLREHLRATIEQVLGGEE